MKIGIYNPYLDSVSGGERYTSYLASHWSKDHAVSIFWNDTRVSERLIERLNIDLSKVRVVPQIIGRNLVARLYTTRSYDVIVWLSDGSIPTTLARHNILHFQVPFETISSKDRWKLSAYDAVVCNSAFTKEHLDPIVGRQAKVIYPPVDVKACKTLKKQKIILSVGRFTSHGHTKKQEILVDAFAQALVRGLLPGWRLVLAGGLLPEDQEYFMSLKKRSSGFSIDLKPNIPFDELTGWYGRSSIYWHAAGYGENNPRNMEHFGISTVEAMGSGCVPIVYKGGGLTEIVRHTTDGYLWSTKEELLAYTQKIIEHESLAQKIREQSEKRALVFDQMEFARSFDELLKQLTT